MLKAKFAAVPARAIALLAVTLALALALFAAAPAMAQDGAATGVSEASETAADTPNNSAGTPEQAPAAQAETSAPAAPAARRYPPVNFDPTVDPENIWVLDLSNGERVLIRLMPEWAPAHVERIKTLTRQGFYDGTVFHRVIEGFMAQGGDPTGTGSGGSQLPDLKAEFNPMPHVRGTVSMARATEEDSANSQFFIVFYPRFSLDRRYTVFGRVIQNMAAVDKIARGEPPANPTRIVQASILADNRPPPAPAQAQGEDDITAEMLNAPIAQ